MTMYSDAGCLCILGVLIAGVAVGCIYGPPYGCLALGCGWVGVGLLWRILTILDPKEKEDEEDGEDK